MKKWMLVLVLAALAAAAAWADYASLELERAAEQEAGYLGKVAAIVGTNAEVKQIRATWTNTAEVVTTVSGGVTNVWTNWSRVELGATTNTLSVGDFVLPGDTLRETGGIPLTTVVLEL